MPTARKTKASSPLDVTITPISPYMTYVRFNSVPKVGDVRKICDDVDPFDYPARKLKTGSVVIDVEVTGPYVEYYPEIYPQIVFVKKTGSPRDNESVYYHNTTKDRDRLIRSLTTLVSDVNALLTEKSKEATMPCNKKNMSKKTTSKSAAYAGKTGSKNPKKSK